MVRSGASVVAEIVVKQFLKSIIARTPYRVVRSINLNRFEAIEQSLENMQKRGYRPKIVIDGGANLGLFSVAVPKIFPEATFHLIEPQPPCIPILRKLCKKNGFVLHEFALADQVGTIELLKTNTPHASAYVNPSNWGEEGITVSASTLDAIFSGEITPSQRGLLKLDINGHELAALSGGTGILRSIEAVLLEVRFLPFGPPFHKLVAFFDDHGFELYDIASLSARHRDNRLAAGDLIFARRDSELMADLGGWW